jgi:hypothetical protein
MKRVWKLAHEKDIAKLSGFLLEREWEHVSFSGHLLEGRTWRLPRRYRKRVFLLPTGNGLRGAVLQTANGFVYPVFHADEPPDQQFVEPLLRELESGFGKVSTLMGVYDDVRAVEVRLSRRPHYVIDYDLLAYPQGGPLEPLRRRPSGQVLDIRPATLADLKALLPLQEAYEREEVLLPGRSLNPSITTRMLQQSIDRQLVLLASLRGRVVAKAATNARGASYDQLGGVFTDPQYRGRGFGTAVVAELTRMILRQNRGVSLFVKKDNLAARRLYSGLGFAHVSDLRIIYYA